MHVWMLEKKTQQHTVYIVILKLFLVCAFYIQIFYFEEWRQQLSIENLFDMGSLFLWF